MSRDDADTSLYDDGSDFGAASNRSKRTGIPLNALSVEQLLELRGEIDSLLPAKSLNDLNLEHELVIQFTFARTLQSEILSSAEEPSKKASVLNACASALQALVKMQSEHHTAERLKNIEQRLIKALLKVPEEYVREFFSWYEGGMDES